MHPHQMAYVIKPKDTLIELLLQTYGKIPGYTWFRPKLWLKAERSFTDITYSMSLIKIGYMVDIIGLQNWRNEALIELLFGKPPEFSIAKFDKLWTVERVEPGAELEQVFLNARQQDLEAIHMTGDSAVDDVLLKLIQIKEAQETKKVYMSSFERVDNIAFCGENPQIMLFGEEGDEYTAAASYWRSVYSPFGEGNVLLLYLGKENQGEQASHAIYSDNLLLAEYLTLTFNQHFDEFKMLNFGNVKAEKASFRQESDSGEFHRLHCETDEHHIELLWEDVRLRQLFILKDLNEGGFGKNGDEHYDVYTNIFLCAKASITLNGKELSGTIRTKQEGEIFRSTAFMAFSETWIKRS